MLNLKEVYCVHRNDGKVFYRTLYELVKEVGLFTISKQFGYGTDFGKYLNYAYRYDANVRYGGYLRFSPVFKYNYFVTTKQGKLIHPNQIIADYCIKYDPTNYYYTKIYKGYNRSHKKRKNSRTYRGMKTTSALRAVSGVQKEEGEPEFRGSRKNLPCKWDDYWIFYERSWKSQSKRKRQYKGS